MKTEEFIRTVLENMRLYMPNGEKTKLLSLNIEQAEFDDSYYNSLYIEWSDHISVWELKNIDTYEIIMSAEFYHQNAYKYNVFEYDVAMATFISFGMIKSCMRIICEFADNTSSLFRVLRLSSLVTLALCADNATMLNTMLTTDWERVTSQIYDLGDMCDSYFEKFCLVKNETVERCFEIRLRTYLKETETSPECKAIMLRWLHEHGETTEGDMKL
jgi:hypothetical protein